MKKTSPDKTKRVKLISRSKVAELFGGVCLRTIARKEKPHGILTPHRLSSRLIAYPEPEVELLIKQSRVAGEAA